jgi:hypothetical protein
VVEGVVVVVSDPPDETVVELPAEQDARVAIRKVAANRSPITFAIFISNLQFLLSYA